MNVLCFHTFFFCLLFWKSSGLSNNTISGKTIVLRNNTSMLNSSSLKRSVLNSSVTKSFVLNISVTNSSVTKSSVRNSSVTNSSVLNNSEINSSFINTTTNSSVVKKNKLNEEKKNLKKKDSKKTDKFLKRVILIIFLILSLTGLYKMYLKIKQLIKEKEEIENEDHLILPGTPGAASPNPIKKSESGNFGFRIDEIISSNANQDLRKRSLFSKSEEKWNV